MCQLVLEFLHSTQRPRRLTALTRKSTTHVVGILGILTCGNNTTHITSVSECTPAGIGNIALLTSVRECTPVVIALLTSVRECTPVVIALLTSVSECTPVVIALLTSVSECTPLVIALLTSVIEGLPRVSSIPPPPCLPSITRKHSRTQLNCRSRSPHSPQHTRWTHHAQHSPSSCDSSLDSSSSSLSSDSSDTHSDTSSSSEQGHHRYRSKHHRNHRRYAYRHRHSSEDSWVANAVVSCAPPIPRHLHRNLKQGKYVNFTSLLFPMDPPPLVPGKQQWREESSHSKRSITDQQIWLEAWNRYASSRIAYDPDIALSLVKCQTLMAMLFRQYTPKGCIEYDRLFRQAAGQDAYLPWDSLNNQIFVYKFTPAHAHTPDVRDHTPFLMPYSCQIKIGSSNEITPFVSTVAPTAPFGNLPSS